MTAKVKGADPAASPASVERAELERVTYSILPELAGVPLPGSVVSTAYAVYREPAVDLHRLVLADALDDASLAPARAELIRVGVEYAALLGTCMFEQPDIKDPVWDRVLELCDREVALLKGTDGREPVLGQGFSDYGKPFGYCQVETARNVVRVGAADRPRLVVTRGFVGEWYGPAGHLVGADPVMDPGTITFRSHPDYKRLLTALTAFPLTTVAFRELCPRWTGASGLRSVGGGDTPAIHVQPNRYVWYRYAGVSGAAAPYGGPLSDHRSAASLPMLAFDLLTDPIRGESGNGVAVYRTEREAAADMGRAIATACRGYTTYMRHAHERRRGERPPASDPDPASPEEIHAVVIDQLRVPLELVRDERLVVSRRAVPGRQLIESRVSVMIPGLGRWLGQPGLANVRPPCRTAEAPLPLGLNGVTGWENVCPRCCGSGYERVPSDEFDPHNPAGGPYYVELTVGLVPLDRNRPCEACLTLGAQPPRCVYEHDGLRWRVLHRLAHCRGCEEPAAPGYGPGSLAYSADPHAEPPGEYGYEYQDDAQDREDELGGEGGNGGNDGG